MVVDEGGSRRGSVVSEQAIYLKDQVFDRGNLFVEVHAFPRPRIGTWGTRHGT